MLYIYPYKLGSASAKALREGLSSKLGYRVKLVRPDGRFRPRRGDMVINWGNSTQPRWELANPDKNHPAAISAASNKTITFTTLNEADIPTPEFTTSRDTAQSWVDEGITTVVRHTVTGHSGQGIELISEGTVPEAPLYTKYKKKRAEFRVHVANGEVIDTVQKKKRNAEDRPDNFTTFIRSHSNGWVFCREGVTDCARRNSIAVAAVSALKLQFGAVDIIYNALEDKYYVLEVNTAPGLEGTTLQKYVEAFTL